MRVPFNKPFLTGNEFAYMSRAIQDGNLSGDGSYTKKCCSFLEKRLNAKKVLLTPSGTHSLELASLLLDLREGDEVIVPSFTFTSTVNAFMLRGARPVFVDIRPDTKNIDENLIEARITDRTRAIFIVHYAGVGCEMSRIMQIAGERKIPVIEDAAQAIDAKYKDRYLGTIGTFGCFSFHETKNIIAGEGGAFLVNDERYLERASVIREKGTNREKFLLGLVDKYTWIETGSSLLMSDMLAAFLYAQLEKIEEIHGRRKQIFEHYKDAFGGLEADGLARLPCIPADCSANYHMFYLQLPSEGTRNELMAFLKERGISASFHYPPLHLAPRGRVFGYQAGDLPVTEAVSGGLLRFPFYNDMTQAEQDYVIATTLSFPWERKDKRGRASASLGGKAKS